MIPPRAGAPDWRAAVRRQAAAAGVDLPLATIEELASHLEELCAAALAEGRSPEEARARAEALLVESSLDALRRRVEADPRRNRARFNELQASVARQPGAHFASACRLAVRQLRLHPRFAFVTMLVLGLGTGAATTVFTIVDSVMLRPLPYAAPDRLVHLWDENHEKGVTREPVSPVNFVDYRALPVFADAAAWWRPSVNLVDPGLEPVRVATVETSVNLFELLGVRPQLGTGFPPAETLHVFDELVIVISDRLWRNRYGADPAVLGRALSLNGQSYTVVGVMPPKFHYPDEIDVWQRLRWDPAQHSRQAHFMEAVARLAPGATFAQAQNACDALGKRLEHDFAESNRAWSVRLVPILDQLLGYYRPALVVLFGAVGLLLVMAVLNVASLLLTRALSREREIAVRVAVGATGRQLVVQLFAESLVLSLGGALVGLAVAAALLPLAVALSPVAIPRLAEAALDWRALGVSVAIVGATTVLFGVVPALLLVRRQVSAELKSGDRGGSRVARRVYSVLVATEVAFACSLLVCSALLVRTVREMTETPTGVRAEEVITASVQISREASTDAASYAATWRKVADLHGRILEAARSRPGVLAAGSSNFLPLQAGWRGPFAVEGEPPPARPEDAPQAQQHAASEGYFETMGARLAQGRLFAATDDAERPAVLVVNESFVRRHLPTKPAVGRRLRVFAGAIGPLGANLKFDRAGGHREHGVSSEIVGVIEDVRNAPLGEPVEPAIYFSARQFPFAEMQVAIAAVDRYSALEALRSAVKEVAPAVPLGEVRSWGERIAAATAEPRLLMSTLLFFGLLAGLLAAIGVYGIFSWSVALRTRELAIRLALGARPTAIGRLVATQTAMLVLFGLAIGLAIVRVADAAVARVLYEISPHDPSSFAAAASVLLVAALLACVAPARRAMRLDPVEGLRQE